MVRKRNEEPRNWLQAEFDRLDKQSPIVETKWVVEEVTPAYNTGGYYDQDIPAKHVTVSPVFDTEAEAVEWLWEHLPDDGKYLEVVKMIAREHKYITWTKVRRGTSRS